MALRFRTEVAVKPEAGKITHRSHIVTVGSCFSDEIGSRLRDRLFDVAINPVGTLYNPMSIAAALDSIMNGREYSATDLVCRDGVWHSFDHHSRFSDSDRDRCLHGINAAMADAREALLRCSHLFVTFGTAWIYTLGGRVVANCHKFPASDFVRSRMSADEIVRVWIPLLDRLREFNPSVTVVFTVSPIRHLADGAHGNQLSKATLLLAVDSIISKTGMTASYFPAYELVLDDLRDYRFYAGDMTHPSDMAVDYVYEKLAGCYFDSATIAASAEAEKLTRFARHRSMTGGDGAIAMHESQLNQKIESLLTAYPDMNRAIHKMFHTI